MLIKYINASHTILSRYIKHNRCNSVLLYRCCDVLVEAGLEVLSEELAGHEAVLPDSDDTAVVDGITQLCEGHVQLVHPVTHTYVTAVGRHGKGTWKALQKKLDPNVWWIRNRMYQMDNMCLTESMC